jgi:hypothetical protein
MLNSAVEPLSGRLSPNSDLRLVDETIRRVNEGTQSNKNRHHDGAERTLHWSMEYWAAMEEISKTMSLT